MFKSVFRLAFILLVSLPLAACRQSAPRQLSATSQQTGQESTTETSASFSDSDALRLAMPAESDDRPEKILWRKAYVTSFNSSTLMPNWVAWRLTKEHTSGSHKRDNEMFSPDTDLPEEWQVNTYDYQQSGYDRGHMCPAGDNKWDAEAMRQCFLMTNMCPQDHNLNGGDWNEMEMQCRKWAQEYGEIYIVCGPIVFKNNTKRIGQQHKVTVPDAFFKVVLTLGDEPKGIGFIYRNRPGDRPKGDYVNSIDEVERITGFDFFPTLPDDVEEKVEAQADLELW